MRRNILSLSLMTILLSSLLIFQNCGKGGKHNTTNGGTLSQGSFDNMQDQISQVAAAEKLVPEVQAQDIYKRLAGVTLSPTSQAYTEMVQYIKAGQREKAAEIATRMDSFYTITVHDFAGKMSTREGTTLAPLSDFVATVMGVIRDGGDARELLTGNFYYRAVDQPGVRQNLADDIVGSNNHYADLEKGNISYPSILKREEGQKYRSPSGAIVTHDDAAGILTSRAYFLAHANAGTNRRLIEYAFKVFECATIDSWASTTNPDSHVGREIGRQPIEEFNNKCKGCHTGMDGMRPATAYYDFFMTDDSTKAGYTKYKYTYTTDPDLDNPAITHPVAADEQGVPSKFRRGTTVFPDGYAVKNNQWINYADTGMFGWNTPVEGAGMHELGVMIAYSDGFRRCMAKRVFSSVCKYDLTANDNGLINKLADDFKYGGYNLKQLFIDVALRPECLGVDP